MRQTTLSVTLEVQPDSASRLSDLINALRGEEENPPPGYAEKYGRLKASVPTLHFMSISIFSSADYDPLFVIEANFDGSQACSGHNSRQRWGRNFGICCATARSP
jgi:hypothetical protein